MLIKGFIPIDYVFYTSIKFALIEYSALVVKCAFVSLIYL